MFNSTVDRENVETFDRVASSWWSHEGPFSLLHNMNAVRVGYILNLAASHFNTLQFPRRTLDGLNFLDIGCGGGILCEPLARLGANVTGIDASSPAIKVATDHASAQNLRINYINSSIENFDSAEKFDVITVLEILEHVDNLEFFIQKIVQHLKPNGLLFFSTLNRNYWSYFGAILFAEHLARWVPKGTHDWNKFIKPSEISKILGNNDLSINSLKGIRLKPISKKWELTSSPTINYIGCARF